MAVELSEEILEQLHTCIKHGLITTLSDELAPYYQTGDYNEFINPNFRVSRVDWETTISNDFWSILLILAAEEELDGYPMHVVEVATEW